MQQLQLASDVGPGFPAAAARRARAMCEAQALADAVRGTGSLLVALSSGNAATIEQACHDAEVVGVGAAAITAARQRLRQLREESLLLAAVGGSNPEEIERECRCAARCGVGEGVIFAARERARQLREARLLSAAVRSLDAAEIERACEEAEAGGVGGAAVEAARRRARHIREEGRLTAAVRLADAWAGAAGTPLVVHAENTEAEGVMEAARLRAKETYLGTQCCTICLEPLASPHTEEVEKLDICTLPCRHAFHGACLLDWLRSQCTCPNCRLPAGEGREPPWRSTVSSGEALAGRVPERGVDPG